MKKLIVLAMLLVAGMLWAQATVTLTGEVETRWLNDFTHKNALQWPEVIIGVNAKVDDNNSLYIEIEEGPRPENPALLTNVAADAGVGDVFPFDKAYFTTDIGKVLKLPVSLTWRTGFDEYDLFDAAKVTFGEVEDRIGSDLHTWGEEINVNVAPAVIRVAWSNDQSNAVKGLLAGLSVNVAPIYAEIGYYVMAEDVGLGDVEAGFEFGQDVAPGINVAVAATLDYDLEEGSSNTYGHLGSSEYTAGAGLNLTYQKMASLGVAWWGVQDYITGGVQVDLWAKPSADQPLELFVAIGLGLDADLYSETFDSVEGSLMYKFGASTWYLGALWIADSTGLNNGLAREKSDFVNPGVDSTSLFMRAELKY